jgi:hypothetical protein
VRRARGVPVTPAVPVPGSPAWAPARPAVLARARTWAPALINAGYLVAAVIVTWRLWAHPASATVAGNPADTDQFAWFLRYEAAAVLHGRLPALVTTTMNPPQGISMMWNTTVLLPGALLAPVTALAGPQVSLTLLLTAGFAGSAASAYYVLRRYGASLAAAAVGGAVYGFSPALMHAAIGHYQLQFAVLPPLIIDAGLRLCLGTSRPVRTGAWLGLLIGAQIFIGEELLFDTALAAIVLVAVLAISRPRAALAAIRPAAGGLAAAAAVTLLLAGWALRSQFFGPLRQHGTAFLPDFYKNDLAGFVIPSNFQVLHTARQAAAAARFQGGAPEYLAYLGVPLICVVLIAGIVFWRQVAVRACAVTLAVLAVLSLGVHPLIDGTLHPGVTLPWGWLTHLPLLDSGLPDRLSLVADGMAAAVLAFAIDLAAARLSQTRLGSQAAGAVVAAVALLAVAPLVPVPLPAAQASPVPPGWQVTLDALRLPAGARVLAVPFPSATITEALRWQADTGDQISLIGGYFEGPDATGQAYIEGPGLPQLAYYLDDLWFGDDAVAAPARADVAAYLAYWNPAAVLADVGPDQPLQRYLRGLFGPPTVSYEGVLGWRQPRLR